MNFKKYFEDKKMAYKNNIRLNKIFSDSNIQINFLVDFSIQKQIVALASLKTWNGLT